jgi:hypothetical protein
MICMERIKGWDRDGWKGIEVPQRKEGFHKVEFFNHPRRNSRGGKFLGSYTRM